MSDSRQSRRRRHRMVQAADRATVPNEANLHAATNEDSSHDDDKAFQPATEREREIYETGFRDGEKAAWSKARKEMEKREEEMTSIWVGGVLFCLVLFTALSVLIVHREALWEALDRY